MNFKIVQFRVIAFIVCFIVIIMAPTNFFKWLKTQRVVIIVTRWTHWHTNEKWKAGPRSTRRTANANMDKRKRCRVKKKVGKQIKNSRHTLIMYVFSPGTHTHTYTTNSNDKKFSQTKKLQLYTFALGLGLSRCITLLRTLDSTVFVCVDVCTWFCWSQTLECGQYRI